MRVRPNLVFQVAEIADDVDIGAKFPRLVARGWLSCTYQAGEVGTEMSVHGTLPTFSGCRVQVRLPVHCRRSALNVGLSAKDRPGSEPQRMRAFDPACVETRGWGVRADHLQGSRYIPG